MKSKYKLFIYQAFIHLFLATFIAFPQEVEWKRLPFPTSPGGLKSIYISSHEDIYLASSGGIYMYDPQNLKWNMQGELRETEHLVINDTGDMFALGSTGLYRKLADEADWQPLIIDQNQSIYLSSIVYVSANDILLVASGLGVYRSSDNGDTWETANQGLPPTALHIQYIAVSPDGIVYVTLYDGILYRSSDLGDNWDILSLSGSFFQFMTITCDGDIYVGNDGYIFRSNDQGESWTMSADKINVIGRFSVTSIHNDTLYAGLYSGHIYVSYNNGMNWELVSIVPVNERLNQVTTTVDGSLFIVYENQIYRTSPDRTHSNRADSGISNPHVTALEITNQDIVLVGTKREGVFKYDYQNDEFTEFNSGLNTKEIRKLFLQSSGAVIARTPSHTFCSGDFFSWQQCNAKFKGDNVDGYVEIDSQEIYFSGESGLYRSSDGGSTWNLVGNPGEILTYDDRFLYVSAFHGLYRFNFQDSTTAYIYSYPKWSGFTSLITLSNGSLMGHYVNPYTSNIFCSVNYGDSWTHCSFAPYPYTCDFAQDPFGTVYVGSSVGIFRTTDNGLSWQPLYDQKAPNILAVSNILYDAHQNRLYLGTWNGMYVSSSLTTVEDESTDMDDLLPIDHHLYQNFPNPFNPTTEISFSIPEQSDVVLTIYDITGRVVNTLVNEWKVAGRHSVTWDGSNKFGNRVGSGVYFYRLQAAGFVQTKRMVVLK